MQLLLTVWGIVNVIGGILSEELNWTELNGTERNWTVTYSSCRYLFLLYYHAVQSTAANCTLRWRCSVHVSWEKTMEQNKTKQNRFLRDCDFDVEKEPLLILVASGYINYTSPLYETSIGHFFVSSLLQHVIKQFMNKNLNASIFH